MKKFCITITRQFGSLGRQIAKEVSAITGIEYYDRDIVEATAKKMNLPVSDISGQEEISSKSSIFNVLFPLGEGSKERQDKIFQVQSQIILDLADQKPCIILGRCGDYILRDMENILNVFIYASEEDRFQNCINILKMDPTKAQKMIGEVDKARNHYYKNYAGYLPDDKAHKQVMLDSSLLGVEGTAQVLAEIIKRRFEI